MSKTEGRPMLAASDQWDEDRLDVILAKIDTMLLPDTLDLHDDLMRLLLSDGLYQPVKEDAQILLTALLTARLAIDLAYTKVSGRSGA